jgi:hypothetical protein
MTTQYHEEIAEVAAILAAGLLRLLARKSTQNLRAGAKTPLDCERECGGDVDRKSEDVVP